MLVDNHELVRMSLTLLLESCEDMEVVAEAASGLQAVELNHAIRPDVILLDLLMANGDGVTATRLLRAQCPQIKILILSGTIDYSLIRTALQAGANDYLIKDGRADELISAIRTLHWQN